ncbi:unnamed protein product [Kluyveromyces dobzhanskii CBS 2104]|uniref:WGS project CCBQ000000000 data, contig 00017 n=1 Tax=Kluyveromyces dobzhanskii CBS 2104 TaxID=1427455 RepID=A0A0A8L612_9SACH|nr:unnamed protein product [Kluyveromyces dobzhanskii CBS 2104]
MLKLIWLVSTIWVAFVAAQFEQEISQCKELETRIGALDLSQCAAGLDQCILATFDMQNESCAACVRVSGNLQTESNCGCLECIISSLNAKCFSAYCPSSGVSNIVLQQLDEELTKNKGVEIPTVVDNTELRYFVDSNENVHRPLFDLEKQRLIRNFLTFAKYQLQNVWVAGVEKREFPCDQVDCERLDALIDENGDEVHDAKFWEKLKKLKEKKGRYKDDDVDDDDEGPCPDDGCTTTYVSTSYKPKKRIMTSWKPIKITITETLTGENCKGKVITKTLWETETETETDWETTTQWKWKKEHTVTATQTTATPVTKVIYKHDKATVTETEFEVSTRTKYKHDKATVTETELEEVTMTKKIAVDTTTITKWKTETETETEWDTTTKVKKKTIPTTLTETTTSTSPTTITETTAITTTASKAKMPLLSGLGFDLLNVDNPQNDSGTDYIVGYTTAKISNVSNKTNSTIKVPLTNFTGYSPSENNSYNSSTKETFESSSSTSTDATKSWIISSIAALVGIVFIFTMTEAKIRPDILERNSDQEPPHSADESEAIAATTGQGTDFEMDTEYLIDADIQNLLRNSIPHAGDSTENLANKLVEDPLQGIAVA